MHTPDEEYEILSEDNGWIDTVFAEELDSWFSADIACCDECYDEFLNLWPHADEADDYGFQRSSIDMQSFYEGSRLREIYTQEQFDVLVTTLRCPRCGAGLEGVIWPYEFPFDIDDSFELELEIESIAEVARNTPFLLLENELAQKIHSLIKQLGESKEAESFTEHLYRARVFKDRRQYDLDDFECPPRSLVGEGRYNHAGLPVLYLGNEIQTCFHELRESKCVAVKVQLRGKAKVLDLTNPYDSSVDGNETLNALVYSSLLSAKHSGDGWHKPEYVFSRFIADCARSAGYDAIKYPSTRVSEGSYNVVFLDQRRSLAKAWNVLNCFVFDGDNVRCYQE